MRAQRRRRNFAAQRDSYSALAPRSPVRIRTTSLHRHDENFPVAYSAGARGALDSLHHLRRQFVRDDYLQLHLGQKIDYVFRAAIELSMALLAAEALDFADRQPLLPRVAPQSASLTSSSLNGLTIASTFFI